MAKAKPVKENMSIADGYESEGRKARTAKQHVTTTAVLQSPCENALKNSGLGRIWYYLFVLGIWYDKASKIPATFMN